MSDQSKKPGFLLSKTSNLVMEVAKHFLRDMENAQVAKRVDKFAQKISSLENLVIKLDAKVQENRRQIQELRTRLVWSLILNLLSVLGIVILIAQAF